MRLGVGGDICEIYNFYMTSMIGDEVRCYEKHIGWEEIVCQSNMFFIIFKGGMNRDIR